MRAATRAVTSSGIGSPARARRRLVGPDRVEPQAEDGVGIEHQPSPLVGGQVGAQDLADDDERARHVEVVIDRRDEPGVEREPALRQRRDRDMGSIARRHGAPAAVPGDIVGDALRPIAGGAGQQGHGRDPRTVCRRRARDRAAGPAATSSADAAPRIEASE